MTENVNRLQLRVKNEQKRVIRAESGATLRVIRTRGSFEERARQHASLLREEIREGVLPIAAAKNEHLIRMGTGLVQIPWIQDRVVEFYRKVLIPILSRHTDRETEGLIAALSEETGVSPSTVREGLFQPDGLMMLSRVSIMKHIMRELPTGGMPIGLPGCTSVVLGRGWTESGKMLVGRNQDYPLVGPWERFATVEYHEPTESGEIPMVSVGTAGIPLAGLTTMNREGLTLATHAHFGRGISMSGMSIVRLGYEVIRRAKSLSEAVDLARKFRRHANWAFVVASAKEKEAIVIEMTPGETHVRTWESGSQEELLIHSNYFQSPGLRGREALVAGGCCEDFYSRVLRANQMLRPLRGKVTVGDIAQILSDQTEPQTGVERMVGGTIGVVTTIKSAVFSPEDQKCWVALRNESPMGLQTRYVELDGEAFWRLTESDELPFVETSGPRDLRLVAATHEFREAYRVWHMDFEEKSVVRRASRSRWHVLRALDLYPDDGHAWIQAGILALIEGKFVDAFQSFTQASERKLPPHATDVTRLFLARCRDLMGERDRAKDGYLLALKDAVEPRLIAAAKKGLRKRYHPSQARHLMLDLQFPDPLQY